MTRVVCIITDRYGPNRLLIEGQLSRSYTTRDDALAAAVERAGEALEKGDHMDLYEELPDRSLVEVQS